MLKVTLETPAINIRLINIPLIFFGAPLDGILTLIESRAAKVQLTGAVKPVISDIYMVYFSLVRHDAPSTLGVEDRVSYRSFLPATASSSAVRRPFRAW